LINSLTFQSSSLELRKPDDEAARAHNKARLQSVFSKQQNDLKKSQASMMERFNELNVEQQEEMLPWLEQVGNFFADLLSWLHDATMEVIDMIAAGWKFVTGKIAEFFAEVEKAISSIFQ